ncbi:MAG: lysophospholipid acyltransferase family protein, partial [Muribaculaceae bacterium]|nr:lysophospholipid acyltransferase family protein [Muribaculaceae bacterium]
METAELRKIERDFYRFLGDYFVETLRLGRMSEKEIRRRMCFENGDEVQRYLEAGRNVTLYLGHYCNWEWVSSIPLHFDRKLHMGQIYHPLENNAADEAFLSIRGRCGATSIKMADTLPTLMKWRREGTPFMVGFIADQVPLFDGMHYFADFLHQETSTFTGPERLSRMFDSVVFYCDIRRDKRGYYTCRYVRMTDNPKSLPQFELTQKYYDMLSESIHRQPALWLWSHNRWKRTKTDFVRLSLSGQTVQRMSVFLLETVC